MQSLTPVMLWAHALASDFDVRPFLDPEDPAVARILTFDGEASYRFRHSVAALCKPRRVLEIGAGRGYGAAAVLSACPEARVALVDRDEAALGKARAMLPGRFPQASLAFVLADSQAADKAWLASLLAEGPFDLVVVDGARGRPAVQQDLQTAWWACQAGGFVLAEGYDACLGTRRAVDDFLFASAAPHLYCGTLYGSVLLNLFKK